MSVSTRSCALCVHFHGVNQGISVAGGTGFAFSDDIRYCSERGIPLNLPNTPIERVDTMLEEWATPCQSFKSVTDPGVETPVTIEAKVSMSVGTNPLAAMVGESVQHARPSSCGECAYLIGTSESMVKFGWPVQICGLTLELLPRKVQTEAASKCTRGVQRHLSSEPLDTSMIHLLPVYGKPKEVSPDDPVEVLRAPVADPQSYSSDLDLDDLDKAEGIKSWRLIKNRVGRGRDIALPIFDPAHFTEFERSLIPAYGSRTNPELYVDHDDDLLYAAASSLLVDERVLVLTGEPGTGKTQMAEYLAFQMGLPFYVYSLRDSMEVSDLLGGMHVTVENGASKTEFVRGPFLEAWTRPSIILLDEVNAAPDEIWHFLRGPLEGKPIVLTEDQGQVIPKHPRCYLIATQNPAWDARNSSVRDLAAADIDRLIFKELTYPEASVERDIIASRCNAMGYPIQHKVLDIIMRVSEEIRRMTDPVQGSGALMISWGMRTNIMVAIATEMRTIGDAYRTVVVDALSPQDREQVMSIVNTYLTEEER